MRNIFDNLYQMVLTFAFEGAIISTRKAHSALYTKETHKNETEDNKMAKWVCTVCGYVHEGDTPPEACPLCKAPADKFVKK